jgi:hypothetical protein
MIRDEVKPDWLQLCFDNNYIDFVEFPEGAAYENAAIHKFMYTWGILAGLNSCGYENRWCYSTEEDAHRALMDWRLRGGEEEPDGWHRELAHGRRRPDGDASREYINW